MAVLYQIQTVERWRRDLGDPSDNLIIQAFCSAYDQKIADLRLELRRIRE